MRNWDVESPNKSSDNERRDYREINLVQHWSQSICLALASFNRRFFLSILISFFFFSPFLSLKNADDMKRLLVVQTTGYTNVSSCWKEKENRVRENKGLGTTGWSWKRETALEEKKSSRRMQSNNEYWLALVSAQGLSMRLGSWDHVSAFVKEVFDRYILGVYLSQRFCKSRWEIDDCMEVWKSDKSKIQIGARLACTMVAKMFGLIILISEMSSTVYCRQYFQRNYCFGNKIDKLSKI